MSKHSNLDRATIQEFGRLENPTLGTKVHVAGWPKGAVYTIVAINDPNVTIQARKSGREVIIHKNMLLNLRD